MNWEYKIERSNWIEEARLNELGADGWELISVNDSPARSENSGNTSTYRSAYVERIFKRPASLR